MKPLRRITKRSSLQNRIINGDSFDALKKLKSKSVNLIMTSPPYADNRKKSYGGIHPDNYVNWFLPLSSELHRVLKDNGSFVLNIKERVNNGERHTYVMELIIALRKQGWLWTEEYIWHKKNSFPGKWPNRFRDSWERCLHFTKYKKFSMYQESVMVQMGDWKKKRMNTSNPNDYTRQSSTVGNNFTKNIANWGDRDMAYPTNVIHMPTECANQNHSAAYPVELPSWFIKLFTKPGDIVLDPFIGSGTTAVASILLDRLYLGIEKHHDYAEIACKRLTSVKNSELYKKRKTKNVQIKVRKEEYRVSC